MRKAAAIPPQVPPANADAAPDWSLVHFDVSCARCGHDLRGQTEPKCPKCALEFTWSQAVPLENLTCEKCEYHLYGLSEPRCPECGEFFEWNDALLRFRRTQRPLFEYRWRDEPIRSLGRTFLGVLRPGRFWRAIDIHDPPNLGALLVLAALSWGVMVTLFSIGLGIFAWLGAAASYAFRPSPAQRLLALRLIELPGIIVDMLWESLSSGLYFWIAFWWVNSLLALLVFRQSMRIYKVCTAHVVRVCAYSVVCSSPIVALIWPFSFSCALVLGWPELDQFDMLNLGLFLTAEAFLCWSIRQGYRHYLRIPHAFGVAVASQAMAFLLTLTATVLVLLLLEGR